MRDESRKIKLERVHQTDTYRIVELENMASLQTSNPINIVVVGDLVTQKQAEDLVNRFKTKIVPGR